MQPGKREVANEEGDNRTGAREEGQRGIRRVCGGAHQSSQRESARRDRHLPAYVLRESMPWIGLAGS